MISNNIFGKIVWLRYTSFFLKFDPNTQFVFDLVNLIVSPMRRKDVRYSPSADVGNDFIGKIIAMLKMKCVVTSKRPKLETVMTEQSPWWKHQVWHHLECSNHSATDDDDDEHTWEDLHDAMCFHMENVIGLPDMKRYRSKQILVRSLDSWQDVVAVCWRYGREHLLSRVFNFEAGRPKQ